MKHDDYTLSYLKAAKELSLDNESEPSENLQVLKSRFMNTFENDWYGLGSLYLLQKHSMLSRKVATSTCLMTRNEAMIENSEALQLSKAGNTIVGKDRFITGFWTWTLRFAGWAVLQNRILYAEKRELIFLTKGLLLTASAFLEVLPLSRTSVLHSSWFEIGSCAFCKKL